MMAARKSAARLALASILIMSLVCPCPALAGAPALQTGDTPAFKLLRMAMTGSLGGGTGDSLDRQILAALLPLLAEITPEEIAAFAAAQGHTVEEALYAYNLALARALAAAIRIGTVSAEGHPETLPVLTLFLEGSAGAEAQKTALRKAMTDETLAALSEEYGLPAGFVRFMVMDTRWTAGNTGLPAGPDSAGTPNGNSGTDGGGTQGGNSGTDGGDTQDGNSGTDGGGTQDGNSGTDGGGTQDGNSGSDGGGTQDGNSGTDGGGTQDGNSGSDGGGQNDGGAGTRKGPGSRK